jgi:hypothetical protein
MVLWVQGVAFCGLQKALSLFKGYAADTVNVEAHE